MEMKDKRGRGKGFGGLPAFPYAGGECQEVLRALYFFLDGECTAENRLAIQEHLNGCSPCLEAFDFEAELKMFVAERCRDQVPDTLRTRIESALLDATKFLPPSEGRGILGT
jgi:mycothiol system anti-sigma-R factor